MASNWMKDWEDQQIDREDAYARWVAEQAELAKKQAEEAATTVDPTALKTDRKLKFGETKYGQLTLFPAIDAQSGNSNPDKPTEND